MKKAVLKEVPLLVIVLLPFIYLAYIWQDLPDEVAVHWNLQGEIDRYGDKTELLLIPFLLPLLIYLIFLLVPVIDPKKKIKNMGSKYHSLKVLLTSFMSLLALYILYSSKNESLSNPNYIVLSMGVLFLILGNYMKTIKANYFIGIKTPWTLENETVWKDTHKLAGKLWFGGGLLIVLGSLILSKENTFPLMIAVIICISLIPVVYSYIRFKQLSNNQKV